MSAFVAIAREEFAFLELEYGYSVLEVEESCSDVYVTYVNRDVGVGLKLLYEFAGSLLFVFVYRLVDGELRDNPRWIDNDTVINCFDLNDYLADDSKMRPSYEYDEDSGYFDPQNGLRNYVKEFAVRLRNYGTLILKGDLSMLPAIESIIRKRAQDWNQWQNPGVKSQKKGSELF